MGNACRADPYTVRYNNENPAMQRGSCITCRGIGSCSADVITWCDDEYCIEA